MRNVFLLLGALAGLADSAQGQSIRYGLKAGVSLARLTNYDIVGVRNQVGATAGVMLDAPLNEKLSLHPEFLFSQKGLRLDETGPGGFSSSRQIRSNYLDLPVLLRLKFGAFFAEIGPQAGYLLTAKRTDVSSSSTIPAATTTTDITQETRRLDLGYVVGMGFQLLERWELGARYNGGLLGVSSENNSTAQGRNSAFQFQAGYLFGGE